MTISNAFKSSANKPRENNCRYRAMTSGLNIYHNHYFSVLVDIILKLEDYLYYHNPTVGRIRGITFSAITSYRNL